jgi:hypothetical protein
MSRQLMFTVVAVAALAFTAVIAMTITWSAIATPAGPFVMTKADFDRSFADAGAATPYATGVQREELRHIGRELLRADEWPVAAK